jgi:CRP-like cAMP-binding protein
MPNANEENLLLASMAREDWNLFDAHLKLVDLTQRQILFDQGDDVVRTYFPSIGTIISLMMPLKNGNAVEVTMIGYEGAAGGIVSAGNKPASARMQVLCEGTAWCIPTSVLEDLKWRSKNLHNIFSRYGDLLLAQTMQSVACNANHTIEQRCSRWLLAMQDRTRGGHLAVTQELLAGLLGVQRTTISSVAQELQSRQIIEYSRGRIAIRNREALHAVACECYDDVDRHLGAILPDVVSARKALLPFGLKS